MAAGASRNNQFDNSKMDQSFGYRGRSQYGGAYDCRRVQVQSSGNDVVDKVRSGLSFNDIKVSRDRSMLNAASEGDRNNFYTKVYNMLSADITNKIFQCTAGTAPMDKCMNVYDNTHKKPFVQRKVDSSATYTDSRDSTKECIAFALVEGFFDCKFWYDEGFEFDVQEVAEMAARCVLHFGVFFTDLRMFH